MLLMMPTTRRNTPTTHSATPPPFRLFPAARVAYPYPSILGEVFDVSKGAKHYGKGGAYEGFTGKDASRSFVSGDFTEVGVCFKVYPQPGAWLTFLPVA